MSDDTARRPASPDDGTTSTTAAAVDSEDSPARELTPLLEPADGVPDVVADERTLLEAARAIAAGTGPVAVDAERGFWTVTIAHTTLTMCFVAVVVQSRLEPLDRSLEEAAMDLGCDPVRAFLAVTLPLIFPAIAAGWMLAFTLSLDDVVIASFTTGPGSATLPIRIYSEVRLGVKPEINAICTLVVALIAVVIVVASLVSKISDARGKAAAPL